MAFVVPTLWAINEPKHDPPQPDTDPSPTLNRSEVQGIRYRLPSIRPDHNRARVQRCRRCAGLPVQGGSAQPGSAAGMLLGRGRVVRHLTTYARTNLQS